MKLRFVIGSLVTFIFAFGLAFFISCTQESIDSAIPTSSPAESVEKSLPQSNEFSIGQRYGGGIIFWIDGTGQHGLIAAPKDQGFTWWGDRAYLTTGATGTAVGTGSTNTMQIIAVQGTQYTYAALLCANYTGRGYDDWFLPSKDELFLLYQQKSVVGGFIRGSYWSSSEFDHSLAWHKYFYNDLAAVSHKDRFNGVRAIRAF